MIRRHCGMKGMLHVFAVRNLPFSRAFAFLLSAFVVSALLLTSCGGNDGEMLYYGTYAFSWESPEDNHVLVQTIELRADGSFFKKMEDKRLDDGEVLHRQTWQGRWRVLEDGKGVHIEENEGVFSYPLARNDDGDLVFDRPDGPAVHVRQ